MNPNYMFVGPWQSNLSCSLATHRRLNGLCSCSTPGCAAELLRYAARITPQ